jgi:hypothetical protein
MSIAWRCVDASRSLSFIKRSRAAAPEVTETVTFRGKLPFNCSTSSAHAGLQGGAIIGLPPVLNFGAPRAQGPRSTGSSLRQEIHLPCHLRAICWKRRDGSQDHGKEDGRRKTLDHQWNEKVDHQWAVRGSVAMVVWDSSEYNTIALQTTSPWMQDRGWVHSYSR